MESDSEPSEPPGISSAGGRSLNSPSIGAPWMIEFNLDDLVGRTLAGENDGSLESTAESEDLADESVQNYLNESGLSLEVMRSAISAVLNQHDVDSAEVSVAIVSGPTMRCLNQKYLQHDFDTDVLSFCLSDPASPDLLAQLIVSVDYARHQVDQLEKETGKSISATDELCLYLVHGTLHTLGYDDHEDADRLEMRQAEREILATIGIVPCWPAEDGSEGAAHE